MHPFLVDRRTWLAQVTSGVVVGAAPAILAASFRGQRRPPPEERVGCNTAIKGFGLYQAIDALERIGFGTIEIHPFGKPEPTPGQIPGFRFDQMARSDREKLKRRLSAFRHRTIHLPFSGLTVISTDPLRQQQGRKAIEVAMDAAEYFECEVAVIHCLPPQGVSLDQAWQQLVALYRQWGERSAAGGYKLAVETGYPGSVARFLDFVREIDHPNVGATIDVGHQIRYAEFRARYPEKPPASPEAYRAYNDVIQLLVEGLGQRLFHLHVHDIDPSLWREHRPIGFGVIDYPRLFRLLQQHQYPGYLVLEVEGAGEELVTELADNREKTPGLGAHLLVGPGPGRTTCREKGR